MEFWVYDNRVHMLARLHRAECTFGDFMAAMRPWSVDKAPPPNFLEPDEGAARLRASFGEEKFQRLVALKDAYDPENVFSLNANIAPSAPAARPLPHLP